MSIAKFNFAAAVTAGSFGVLCLLLFLAGYIGDDPHAGLWGLFWAAVVLPFAPAFWLAGWAWRREWSSAPAVQFAPVLVLLALFYLFSWWASLASVPPAP